MINPDYMTPEQEITYWRERYEEASRQSDILRRECNCVDALEAEIDEIQIMVGCNHVEGLARCVRERLEGVT